MLDIDELLSDENQAQALSVLHSKRDGCGPDGLRISEFDTYWKANHDRIEASIRACTYKPTIAKVFEITGSNGKRREIANINVIDRYIERLLQQVLQKHIEPLFLSNSFAYQQGKGTLNAAMTARDYIAEGKTWLCEIDIADFFDTIAIDLVLNELKKIVEDNCVVSLVNAYLHREVEREGKIRAIKRGVLQGSSISPTMANLYLHPLDQHLESLGLNWIRFADNIYVYSEEREAAEKAFEVICGRLSIHHRLRINTKKSGVYQALDRRVLGFDFAAVEGGIEIRKHHYQPASSYRTWHASVARKENGVYHIIQDGILNRKDYSLLFENDEERHHIPVEVTDQINVYGSVTVSPEAIKTISREQIRIAYFDDYGELLGMYTPTRHGKAAHVFLKQCELYANETWRLETARKLEIASIHNMRANLRYYQKKGFSFKELIATLSNCISEVNESTSVEGLMLIEARARKEYYSGFSEIVSGAGFSFTQRTKQPPRDACNALISFGNTVLYNQILQQIWKTSLDPKVGVVHATNRRNYSLNLDFADLFKPIIVDRVIFALVNRHEIKQSLHFRTTDEGAVLLNRAGKRLFLERLDQKLETLIHRKGQSVTYRRLMANELMAFQRMLVDGEAYRPYKYY